MCGIAGIVGSSWEPRQVDAMVDSLAHRGPDDRGTALCPEQGVGLGHTRLSILDLSEAGHQPMQSDDGRYLLVYNGELYNHADFRPDLESQGVSFRGHSDTETLLHLLIRDGAACIPRLNGIFALAFLDRRENSLLLCRDPVGVKPLYYARPDGNTLVFASEIKALFASGLVEPRLNREDLPELLMFHFIAGERTAFEGVYELPPGHTATLDAQRTFRLETYWDPVMDRPPENPPETPDLIASLRTDIHRAVQAQLMSDVPLGVMLSGGIDSGLVAACARTEGPPVQGYCYIDPERGYNEYQDAEVLAQAFGVNLQPVRIDEPDVPSLLETLTWHYDEPLPRPHHLAAYAVSRAAQQDGVKVLLTGEGGDEIFGGYVRYVHFEEEMKRTGDLAPLVFQHNRVALPRIARFYDHPPFQDGFRFRAADNLGHLDLVNQQLIVDQKTFLQHFLQRSDRMGMAVGLENRVPLLDIDLVRRINRVPGSLKIQQGITKYLIREVARGLLPEAIVDLPKQPFDMPIDSMLLQGPVAECMNDLLLSKARCHDLFDEAGLAGLMRDFRNGDNDLWKIIWMVFTFELWLRAFNVSV